MQPDENFWKKCEGEQIANAYELEQLLGCGAFGGVFKAVQIANGRRLNKRVAVKLMLSGAIQHEELNFALDLPSHQNLVQHFAGNNVEIRGFPMFYLVMELADCSLADFVKKRGGRISSVEAKPIVRDIAQGLKFLHELDGSNSQDKRYVHRDLKLLNILQVSNVWKIADFGLSKALDRSTMQASKIAGTLHYMPPELFRNRYVSTKWDIWSLGVMIVEILTGHLPFDSPYQDELERKIQIDIPDLEGVPSEWIDIVKGCFIRDHNQRWGAMDILTAINSPSLKATVFSKTATDFFDDGRKKYDEKDFKGAIADYDEAIRLNPDYANAYLHRGDTKIKLGYRKASEMYIDYMQEEREIYLNRPFLLRIFTKPNYKYSPMEIKEKCTKVFDKSCYKAIADYNEAIRIKPDFAEAYNNRGDAKSALEDKQSAIADYNEAIRLNPDFAEAYYNRGSAKNNLGDKQGAIADYNQAICFKPDYANAYYNRGLIKKERGKKQEALADFRKAAELYHKQGNTEFYNQSRDRIRELGG